MRRLRMSKVPIAGQPSLSANAIGVSPSFFICARERLELVERLRDLVAVLLEHALAVEERPRVVVERDEELLGAVGARRRALQRVGVVGADLPPHVGDVGRQPALREELHPVAREPREDVVRLALQVAVDLLLEGVVVDRVDLDVAAGLGLERREDLLVGRLRHRVGRVGAERDACRRLLLGAVPPPEGAASSSPPQPTSAAGTAAAAAVPAKPLSRFRRLSVA